MKAIVLGGSGFLGSYMIEELLNNNYQVLNIDAVESKCEHSSIESSYSFCRHTVGANSQYNLEQIFMHYKPDVVFNFISTADLAACDEDPLKCVQNNVVSNALILKCLDSIFCKYVYASSVYAGCADAMFYGWSKRTVEEYIKKWFKNRCNSFVILRYGTVYGPRATKENGLRRIIEKALKEKVISLYGTGEESREYIFAADAAKVSLEIVNHIDNKVVKITGTQSIKAKDVGFMIKEILGEDYSLVFENHRPKGHYRMTPYRLIQDYPMNYTSSWHHDFGYGVLKTIEYIKDNERL